MTPSHVQTPRQQALLLLGNRVHHAHEPLERVHVHVGVEEGVSPHLGVRDAGSGGNSRKVGQLQFGEGWRRLLELQKKIMLLKKIK